MIGALLLGGVLGTLNPLYSVVITGFIIMAFLIFLRQDELAVTGVIAINVYVDWFLGLHLVGLVVALTLLFIYFLGRSPQHPWVEPRPLWLWVVFLVLTIYPAIHGALMLYDAVSYYPGDVLGALMMFWLGGIIARDIVSVRLFFKIIAGFAALLAAHTIIQATTGTILFETEHISTYLATVSNYQLTRTEVHRAGSFFIDPNWNGAFFSMIFFLPLGLFIESKFLLEKLLYLAEMFLILPALLFIYSNGAWISIEAGAVVFVAFVGCSRYRVLLPLFIFAIVLVMMAAFPAQIAIQFQHAADPDEVLLRIGAWQTAIRVISAFPLTGVGLGYQAYMLRAEPYRVSAQFFPLTHPHNSYLEWGAMAGLPVLIVFMMLLAYALWLAWRNWLLVDASIRPLLGGGIAAIMALSINSLSINGWTISPLAAIGWLLLGTLSSPLLVKGQTRTDVKEMANEVNRKDLLK